MPGCPHGVRHLRQDRVKRAAEGFFERLLLRQGVSIHKAYIKSHDCTVCPSASRQSAVASQIPSPPDMTDEEVLAAVSTGDSSNYSVPMSIGEPHAELDHGAPPSHEYG